MFAATMGMDVSGLMTQVAMTTMAAAVVISCFATFGLLSATLYK